MKNLLSILFAGAAASALAYSHIDPASVSWTQVKSGTVRVDYTLSGAPASVSLSSILTNGVSVGAIPGTELSGDVNGIVQPGARSFTWTMSEKALIESKLPEGVWSFKLDVRNANRLPDYLALNIADGSVVFYGSAAEVPGGMTAETWKTTHLLMRRIPAANVAARLGLGVGDYKNSSYNYAPPYEHVFEEDYYMAVYETTQGQYALMGASSPYPSAYGESSFANCTSGTHKSTHGTDWKWHPVERVSYSQASAVAATLTARSAAANSYGFTFALPTEDQWEFACRAGSSKDVYGNIRRVSLSGVVNSVYVNFQKMSNYYGGGTSGYNVYRPGYAVPIPVGNLTPNAWGLYDMLGNVREWCTATRGGTIVTRGGGCGMSGEPMTAACREVEITSSTATSSLVGFRLVCNLKAE